MNQSLEAKMKHTGIIILGGHVQSLGILRILGRQKIHGIIIDNTDLNISRHSRYCTQFYKVKDEALLNFLFNWAETGQFKRWVIFPTNDFHVGLLSQNKPKLEKHFIVSTDYWDAIKIFYNKKSSYELALTLDIPVPTTLYLQSENDIENVEISFPCIIKPAVMHNFYRKVKKKVLVCRNRAELKNNYLEALTVIPAEEIMIQEIIPGPSSLQYSACFLYLNKKEVIS